MSLTLPDRPAQHFIDEVLLPEWDPDDALGFDPRIAPDAEGFGDDLGDDFGTNSEGFVPVATTLDNVGASYPSLVVQYSNETSGGESTYDYMTTSGPGQNRQGTLLAIARVEAEQGGYTGDAATYDPLPADDLAVALVEAVENTCQQAADGGDSAFRTVGSQRGPEAPDDREVSPPVRIANTQVDYSWLRQP